MYKMDKRIVSLFLETKSQIESQICFQNKQKLKYFLVKIYYKILGKNIKNNVNYDLIAQEFNKIYFWKNFIKCLTFFHDFPLEIQDEILDVGCGAGAASISYAKIALAKNNKEIKVYLLDKSKQQLQYAEQFLRILSINHEKGKSEHFEIKNNSFKKFVVFSYFFCEQNDKFIKLLFENRANFKKGFVIIDYKENIEKISNYFKDNKDYNIISIYRCYTIPKIIYKIIDEKKVNVYGCYYNAEK